MVSYRVTDFLEIFVFDDGRIFALLSYAYDVNFLEQLVPCAGLKVIRSGTYAYCYDFVANIGKR